MQSNTCDCEVYAIALGTSLALGYKPEMIRYDNSKMRNHLVKILKHNVVEHFPVAKW